MVSAMFCTVGIVVKAPMINTNRNFEKSIKDGSTVQHALTYIALTWTNKQPKSQTMKG